MAVNCRNIEQAKEEIMIITEKQELRLLPFFFDRIARRH
jgi:hypothetical protein